LPRQIGRNVSRAFNLFEIAMLRRPSSSRQQEFGIAEDAATGFEVMPTPPASRPMASIFVIAESC
jgi:hypothetical protein